MNDFNSYSAQNLRKLQHLDHLKVRLSSQYASVWNTYVKMKNVIKMKKTISDLIGYCLMVV